MQAENSASTATISRLIELSTSGAGIEQVKTFVSKVEQRNEAFHGMFKRVINDTQRLIEREELLEGRYNDEVNKRQDAEQKLRDYEDMKLQANFGDEFNQPVHSGSKSPIDHVEVYDAHAAQRIEAEKNGPKAIGQTGREFKSKSSEEISQESEQEEEMEKLDVAPIYESAPGKFQVTNSNGVDPLDVHPEPLREYDDMFAAKPSEKLADFDDVFGDSLAAKPEGFEFGAIKPLESWANDKDDKDSDDMFSAKPERKPEHKEKKHEAKKDDDEDFF